MFVAWVERWGRSLSLRISVWYACGFFVSFLLVVLFARWIITDAGARADRDEILQEFTLDSTRYRQLGAERFQREQEEESADVETTLLRLSRPDGSTRTIVPPLGVGKALVPRLDQQLLAHREKGWQRFRSDDGENLWQVYADQMPDGGWLQVAKSDDRSQELQERLGHALLPVTGLVIILALAGAAGFTTRALRPLRRLIDTTRAVVDSGDMTARVPIKAGRGSELDELNGLFNRMLAKNEGLIRGMREALDHVAHDLRTPLARWRSSAETALRDKNPTVESRGEALGEAVEESERVSAILRILMDISEAEHGTMRLNLEVAELAPLVAIAVGLYEYVAEARNVTICSAVPAGLVVLADALRVQQIVSNLLDNAIKYSDHGGTVHLAAGSGESPSEVWLSVRDDGAGIAAHDLPRIWDRLYRGDQSRSEPGQGLGLSLVKAVVEAHQGRVTVFSRAGHGSIFKIFLPASTNHPARKD